MTKIFNINPDKPNLKLLKSASNILDKGGIVAFPTETVYGLGACVFNDEALSKIFKAKGRPSDNPLIVHISDESMLKELVSRVPRNARLLMQKFWPGPLTLIFPKSKKVPYTVTAGLETVAVRMPSHPVARILIDILGCPIAAPSANTSTKPSPTNAKHVIEDLYGKIDAIIDGGSSDIGLESTVLDITRKPNLILRPGGITYEELSKVIDVEKYIVNDKDRPKSPGMKYKHYSPNAKLILLEGKKMSVRKKMRELVNYYHKKNLRVGVLVAEGYYNADVVLFLNTKEELAKHLFSSFRTFDNMNIDIILMESVSITGIGDAILNRVEKAAHKKIVLK